MANTPAYAGKTHEQSTKRSPAQKHPRLRGEDKENPDIKPEALETPPLTRGRLHAVGRRVGRRGNTPAYAGKTDHPVRQKEKDEKHPRLRGEDLLLSVCLTIAAETPPLTRGRRNVNLDNARIRGNTPAYAGKTSIFK